MKAPALPLQNWMSVEDAAKRLNVHEQQVYSWCKLWREHRGTIGLPHAMFSRRMIRISEDGLERFLRAQERCTAG